MHQVASNIFMVLFLAVKGLQVVSLTMVTAIEMESKSECQYPQANEKLSKTL